MEGGHYMDLQKLQGCRCLGGPVAGVLVAGGSVMAFRHMRLATGTKQ